MRLRLNLSVTVCFGIIVIPTVNRVSDEYCFLLQDLKKAGVLIYANKQDVKGSMSATEITQHLNLTSIKDHGWHIQACCALTGEG